MAGLATRIVIAERVAAQLVADGAPEAGLVQSHKEWFLFGALGPAIGDFVPSDVPQGFGAPGRTPYWAAWKEMMVIGVGDQANGIPGLVGVLRTINGLLNEIATHVANQDLQGLKDMIDAGAEQRLNQASADLGIILQTFSQPARLFLLGNLMGAASQPAIDNDTMLVPETMWTGRDWLHWKKPGAFATALRDRAEQSGSDALRAYALGWQVAYAGLVSGSGFVNSAVGSCYRTHWWRHRWVCNFIDTWAWGFYRAGAQMQGDLPTPAFRDWPGLCDAGLHSMVDVAAGQGTDCQALAMAMAAEQPLPDLLPSEFTDMWVAAFGDAYGSVTPPLFTPAALQRGYAGMLAVLWFQTSGQVIGCNPNPGPPPSACGSAPAWIDPTKTNPDTGQPFQPQAPTPESDPDVGEIVSGAALVLLGLGLLFFGGGAAGGAALAGGISLIVSGATDVDWEDLECDLYWIRVYMHNGLAALHKLAVLGAAQHPYPSDLEVNQLVLSFNGGSLPYTSGAAVCKSHAMEGLHEPWGGMLSSWTNPPTESLERAITDVWRLGDLWPSAIVDDDGANPMTEDILAVPANWPGGVKGSFGPAVQNALHLIHSAPGSLPDWNLDGDRGRGWLTWELAAPYTNPVAPVPET